MSTNYYNPLALIDVTTLSEKGQQQVNDFIEYLRPRYSTIKDGEITKEEVARHYLEMEASYTDGAKARISTLTEGLGISKGYLSKIRNAGKLLEEYSGSPTTSKWIEEHPVSCQYLMGRVSHNDLYRKISSGTHFTKSELETIIKKNKEETVSQPTEETKTHYQLQQERFKQMVESDEKQLIRTTGAAACYMSGNRKDVLAAAAQVLYDIKYQDKNLERILEVIKTLSQKALEKEPYVAPSRLSEVK